MKYSNITGIVFCLLLVGVCFLPWSYVQYIHVTLSGVNGYINKDLDYGRQIIPHSFFALILIGLFVIPKIWAKRTNVFIAAINFAFSIKNYILFSLCREGICPEKKAGIFLLVFICLVIQIMTLFPKMDVAEN